ncbi:MAG: esterase [Porticoccaceae bacterium]|nr:MAG: esterase [Porticoccaceae bacterium]
MSAPHRFAFALALAAVLAAPAAAETPPRPQFLPDGTVVVPSFRLPPSALASPEARAFMKARASLGTLPTQVQDPDAARARAALAAQLQPKVEQMLERYPVRVAETTLAGVPVREIVPAAGGEDAERVLVNLHGGAFTTCWESCSLLESAPVAVTGRFRVIAVNYRMAPEARHPAAVEDVAKVYRALLDRYPPTRIGIFGCSAGGNLTAQAAAWFARHQIPQPAAIGIFGAGGVRFGAGDSGYIAAYVDGSFPAPGPDGKPPFDITRGYFAGVAPGDPIAEPALHPELLAQFPPALIITGTRAMDLSPAVVTNNALLAAGRESTLVVGEGMGHCYLYSPELPEAQQAYALIARFFRRHLGG